MWDKLDNLIHKTKWSEDDDDLTLGFLRYEELRKLNVRQFSELIERNLAGENFDEMIDELIIKNRINE